MSARRAPKPRATERAVRERRRGMRAVAGGTARADRFPERTLLWAVRAGLALVLLTPLAVAPDTFYPFAIGKAVYARSTIAVVFALWAVLALARPRWRPAPGPVLAAMLAGLAIGGACAWFGISPQRSLWSTYTRMGGLVDTAHWCAYLVVLVAVVRRAGDWERLLNVHLAVGLGVGAFAALRLSMPEAGLSVWGLEPRFPRISGTTGNPTFLGGYLQGVALLAAGFLARSAVGTGAAARGSSRPGRWAARGFWLAAMCSALAGLAASGTLGALAGLGAGAAGAGTLYAWLGATPGERRAGRLALAATLGAAALLAAVIAIRAGDPPGRGGEGLAGGVLIERATSAERIAEPLAMRSQNWEAGLRGFAERPWLGWGPENYFAANARHMARRDGPVREFDRAHNMIVQEAATKGVLGLAAYLALWGLTLRAVVLAARGAGARDRALIVFAGAALAGWFVQSQSLFYSPSTWMQHMLLLGFVASFEPSLRAASAMPERWQARLAAASRRRALRAAAGLGTALLAAASLASSHAIHAGGAAIHRAEFAGPFLEEMERSIEAFEPLANRPRIILLNNLAANWAALAAGDRAELERLRAWAMREAAAALATEPDSWVLHHALARLYRATATTHPGDDVPARRHFVRSLELAPHLDPLEAPRPGDDRR